MTLPLSDAFPEYLAGALATRANDRCSNPDCRARTDGLQIFAPNARTRVAAHIRDAPPADVLRIDTSKRTLVGVAAHIITASPGAPRYDETFTPKQLAAVANAIWLCPSCARLIDNDRQRFNADLLREWKETAEVDALAMQMLEQKGPLGPRVARYGRFLKAPRQSLPFIEQMGILRAVGRWLDRHLTRSPPKLDVSWRDVEPQTPEEVSAEQARTYAHAMVEFRTAPEGTVEAWLERKRLQTSWFDRGEYRRAKRNSVFASFLGILVTHTGLYPTKIPALGVEFPPLSKPAFLVFLFFGTWYLTLGMNMYLRGFLIDNALIEIAQARKGVLRDFTNRWSRFIDVTWAEKGMFDRRIPNVLCLYATVSIVVSIVRFFL